MTGHLVPGDDGWIADKALLANLSHVNTEITRYVLGQLDVDARRSEPIPTEDERAFGQRLIDLGAQVQQRAAQRQAKPGRPVIDANPEPLALEPGMDHGP